MLLSSRLSADPWRWFPVGGVVAEHGPEDVDAAPGEGDERLLVGLSLARVSGRRRFARPGCSSGWRGRRGSRSAGVAVEPARSVQVAADSSGVAWDRGQTRRRWRAGRRSRTRPGCRRCSRGKLLQERGRTRACSAEDRRSRAAGSVADLLVDVGDLCIDGADLLGQPNDQSCARWSVQAGRCAGSWRRPVPSRPCWRCSGSRVSSASRPAWSVRSAGCPPGFGSRPSRIRGAFLE